MFAAFTRPVNIIRFDAAMAATVLRLIKDRLVIPLFDSFFIELYSFGLLNFSQFALDAIFGFWVLDEGNPLRSGSGIARFDRAHG